MIGEYKIITLCGSVKFKDEFLKEQQRLTLDGNIVFMPVFFENISEDILFSDNIKQMLDDMHKRKIDISDEIFVVNKNNYIGASTKSEIEYAIKMNKNVVYLEK